jgi:hypothetical protein
MVRSALIRGMWVVATHGGTLRHWIYVPGNGVAACGFAPKELPRRRSPGFRAAWISLAVATGKTEMRQVSLCGTCAERRYQRRT